MQFQPGIMPCRTMLFGPGERSTNRFIGGGKSGDVSAPQGAYLYQPAGNRSRKGGHPQRWKAQTGRETADEFATWLNREHGEVGIYLVQVLSGHGCFNEYQRRFKKRDEEICCYCDFPVDNAEHALFVCAKWGAAREASVRQWVPSSLLTRWSFSCSSLSGTVRS